MILAYLVRISYISGLELRNRSYTACEQTRAHNLSASRVDSLRERFHLDPSKHRISYDIIVTTFEKPQAVPGS